METGYGLCECGCGGETNRARQTDTKRGFVRGEPHRFIHGHGNFARYTLPEWIEEDRSYKTPCWIWQASTDKLGYGRKYIGGGRKNRLHMLAHKWLWESINEQPVPDGLELDHLCRIPSCVNPDHLEPVTHGENVRRGVAARNA